MCDRCAWEKTLEEIDSVLVRENLPPDGVDFLESVREWIETHEHVTDAQAEAIGQWSR